MCRTSAFGPSHRIIAQSRLACRPAGLHGDHDGSSRLVSGQRPGHACCVAAIRWTATASPAAPAARQPSYSSPRPHTPTPTPTPTTPAVPYQATMGKSGAHHRAVSWRPDGPRRRPAAGPRPNNPDPRPFIKFSEDPASESPLSSLTLVLTRELERGRHRGATVACAPDTVTINNGACPGALLFLILAGVQAEPLCLQLSSYRPVPQPRPGCQVDSAALLRLSVLAGPVGTERLNRTMRLRVSGCILLHRAVGLRCWRYVRGIFASCCPVCNRLRLLAR